jgi:hypothetical protein
MRHHILVLYLALTLSAASAGEPWRFIVAGDSQGSFGGVNAPIFSDLVGEILRQDVDFVLFTGDLVVGERANFDRFEAQLWEWVRIMQPVYDAGIGVYACRGNHEVRDMWGAVAGTMPNPGDNGALRWLSVFGNPEHPQLLLPDNGPLDERHMTYAASHKNALIVGLDLYGGMDHWPAHGLNQAWLDAQLEQNTRPHVFVFGHEPAFRAFHFDCLDAHPQRRDAFWKSLKRAGGRTYFCGHDHFYDHAVVDDGDGDPDNDIHQIIAGGAGGPLYTFSPPYDGNNTDYTVHQRYHARQRGYMLVEVDDLDVTVIWMERLEGTAWWPTLYVARDIWTYRVTPGPIIVRPNGAERVVASQPYDVQWTMTPGAAVARVVLEYSLDGGTNWDFASEVANTGAYRWTAPAVNSDRCLMRVRDADAPAVRDTSDAPFSILTCQTKLRADLNGDCYVDFADLAILMSEWLACGNPLDPACGTPQ